LSVYIFTGGNSLKNEAGCEAVNDQYWPKPGSKIYTFIHVLPSVLLRQASVVNHKSSKKGEAFFHHRVFIKNNSEKDFTCIILQAHLALCSTAHGELEE